MITLLLLYLLPMLPFVLFLIVSQNSYTRDFYGDIGDTNKLTRYEWFTTILLMILPIVNLIMGAYLLSHTLDTIINNRCYFKNSKLQKFKNWLNYVPFKSKDKK